MHVGSHRRIGAFLFLVLTTALAAEAASLKDVEKFARECSGGKQDSCRRIERIALLEKNSEVREAAVRRISNQALLAVIAKGDQTERVRLAAVETLTDQSVLRELAVNADDLAVTTAALGRLSQRSLREIVLALSPWRTPSIAALKLLTDGDELATLVTSEEFKGDTASVLARIQNEPALARVATSSVDSKHAEAAARRLTDQALLRQVAETAHSGIAAIAAVEKLDDQRVVRELALAPRGPGRLAAIARLEDQETLTRIALESPDQASRARAVSRLSDQALLRTLALESEDRPSRLAATRALADQAALAEVVQRHSEDRELVWAGVGRLSDPKAAGRVFGMTVEAAIKQGRAYEARGDGAREEALLASELRTGTKVALESEAFFFGMAMKAYSHAIALAPGNAAAYGLRAVTRAKHDRDVTKHIVMIDFGTAIPMAEFGPESLADADQAVKLAPADAQSHFARATVRSIQLSTQWAAYRQVPAKHQKMAESLKPDLQLADLAARDLKLILKMDPKHCEAFATLGRVLTIQALLAPNQDVGELPVRPANCKP